MRKFNAKNLYVRTAAILLKIVEFCCILLKDTRIRRRENVLLEIDYYISVTIKRYLDERDMKSYKLAEASGCNKTAVNNWLYRRQMPSAKALMRLADYMNVSLDYMLGLKKTPDIIRSGTPEKFARRVNRLQNGEITSYQIAKICGTGTSAVSKWKDFSRLPKIEILIKLSALFGCSVDYLLGRTNIPNY